MGSKVRQLRDRFFTPWANHDSRLYHLKDLVQGREPNQASEEIDDSDYLSMQLQSVEGKLDKKIDDVSSKVRVFPTRLVST